MTWTYICDDDQRVISADTKEQLAEKYMQHLNQMHNMNITKEQAMDAVNKNARQVA